MILRRIFALLLLSLALSLPSTGCLADPAAPVDWSVQSPGKLQLAADAGDREAQYLLSLMFFAGEGIKQNTLLGLKYLEMAARAEQVDAQFNLGNYYNLYQMNYERAHYWWSLAAQQGLASAQLNLGGLYEKGLGVTVDREQARYWYELAAAQGEGEARRALAALPAVVSSFVKTGAGDELHLRTSPQLSHLPDRP